MQAMLVVNADNSWSDSMHGAIEADLETALTRRRVNSMNMLKYKGIISNGL